MNNSSFMGLLKNINDEKAIVLIPAIVFIAVLMLTGLIGNIVVCYFYGCRTKASPTSCFILNMAILDLLSCTISMPLEILDMRFKYMFPDATVCKVLRATNFVFTISSRLILVAIAMERYRRICSPFRKQFTVSHARLIGCISVLIACVLSWPSLVLYTVVVIDVPIAGSEVIKGYDCTTVRDDSLNAYLNAFKVVQILLFIFTVLPLTVLYALVYRQFSRRNLFRNEETGKFCIYPKPTVFLKNDTSSLGKSNKDKETLSRCHNDTEGTVSKMQQKPIEGSNVANNFLAEVESGRNDMTKETLFVREEHIKLSKHNSPNNNESIRSNELEQTDIRAKQELGVNNEDDFTDRTSRNLKNENISGESNTIRERSECYFDRKRVTDLKNVRNTALMLILTITFVVSFLPYMCLIVWRSLSTHNVVNKMTDIHLIFYEIGIRSYFLNCAINPVIYGFVNSKFRRFCAYRVAKSNSKLEKKRRDKL